MSFLAKLRLLFYISVVFFLHFVYVEHYLSLPQNLVVKEFNNFIQYVFKAKPKLAVTFVKPRAKKQNKMENYPYLIGATGIVLSNDKELAWKLVDLKQTYSSVATLKNSQAVFRVSNNANLLLTPNTRVSLRPCINIYTGCVRFYLTGIMPLKTCVNQQEEVIFEDKDFCAPNFDTLEHNSFQPFLEGYVKPSFADKINSEVWTGKNVKSDISLLSPSDSTVFLKGEQLTFKWQSKKAKCKIFISNDEMFTNIVYTAKLKGDNITLDTRAYKSGVYYWKLACNNSSSRTARFYLYNTDSIKILEPLSTVKYTGLPILVRWSKIYGTKEYNVIISNNKQFNDIAVSLKTNSNYTFVDIDRGIYFLKVVAIFGETKTLETKIKRILVK